MKLLILSCLVALAAADVVPIVKQDAEINPDGSYQWSYEADNGIQAQEQGQLNGDAEVVQGSVSYTSPDGTPVKLTYVADENGYQPQGDHLPLAPGIPPSIQRALEWNAAHPEQA